MKPLLESVQADHWFGPFTLHDQDLLPRLSALGAEVASLVPDCVGMSVSIIEHGATFTVAASDADVLLLDASQYVADGPCLRAERAASILSWHGDDAEETWRVFCLATAAAGVASTLSLPIVHDGVATGGFNLYASSARAFDGMHERLAGLLGAWAEGATINADLAFTTRDLAREAPARLRDSARLSAAAAFLAGQVGCDLDTAVDRLVQAASQADIPLTALVDAICDSWR